MPAIRALGLACLSAAGLARIAAAAPESPCAGQYADWVGEPSAFVREDEPKNLQGLHVVCAWKPDASAPVNFEAFPNAVNTGAPPPRYELRAQALQSWKDFRQEIKLALRISTRTNDWQHQELKQPFGIFAASGKRLGSIEEVLQAKLVFVSEGGQWFWPPIRKGFVRQVADGLELETMSVQPVMFRVRGFLRDEECTEIVKVADGRMAASPVSLMDRDKGKEAKEFRTSTQSFLKTADSKYLAGINDRVSRLTRVPPVNNEDVQVLRYQKSQYYSVHMDNWDPSLYTGDDSAFMEYGHNNRMITVFWYLSNVSQGGQTLFPRADGLPAPRDVYACDKGLKVQPERGAVIFWYSLRPNGNSDENGAHSACPVLSAEEKWSANFWVWNKPRNRAPMADDGVDEAEPDLGQPQGAGSGGAPPDRGPPPDPNMVQVMATFSNQHPSESIEMFWQDPQSKSEVPQGPIPPGGQQVMNSWSGHVWVFKAAKWTHKVTMSKDPEQSFALRPKGPNEDL